MIIEKILLSPEEHREAVHQWLSRKGITLPVTSAGKKHSWDDQITVELDTDPKIPESKPLTASDLGAMAEPVQLPT